LDDTGEGFALSQTMKRDLPVLRQLMMHLVGDPVSPRDHLGMSSRKQIKDAPGQRVFDFPIQGSILKIGKITLTLAIEWTDLHKLRRHRT
jgi:hypothetical protein